MQHGNAAKSLEGNSQEPIAAPAQIGPDSAYSPVNWQVARLVDGLEDLIEDAADRFVRLSEPIPPGILDEIATQRGRVFAAQAVVRFADKFGAKLEAVSQ